MSLMDFLVTSNTRKELLSLLWGQKEEGSGYQLAKLVGCAYSSVHAELEAMKKEGLVTSSQKGHSLIFRKDDSYPWRNELTTLLGNPKRLVEPNMELSDNEVRLNLSKHGAPLGVRGVSNQDLPLEETLVYALSLARRDATVARVLPVVFAKNMDVLDLPRLEFLARKKGVLPVLGLFLDLTALLMKDPKLRKKARQFMDRRRKRTENFFVGRKLNSFEKELANKNTPPVARDWHFLLNMGMDSFESLFRKNFN